MDRHEKAWEAYLLIHGHPNDLYFSVQRERDGSVVYAQNTRDWPEIVMDDLAMEWAETFERWGREL